MKVLRLIALATIVLFATILGQAMAQSGPSCWEGNFPFGAYVRWCLDPSTKTTTGMSVIIPGNPPLTVRISSQDDDHKQDLEHEIRHRVTVSFAGLPHGPNQLPIRVTARYNIQKMGDTIFEWDEWNDAKCIQRTLNVDANKCWFHQTGWHQMTRK